MSLCHHQDDPDPDGRPTTSLEPEALFVLGALRSWIAAHRPGGAAPIDWRQVFALAELPWPVASAFGSLMSVIRHGMRRPLDFRCCPCPQLGRDEEAVFRIIAALQQGDRLGAVEEFADWLYPESVIPALDAASALALQFGANGVTLSIAGTPTQCLTARGVGHPARH